MASSVHAAATEEENAGADPQPLPVLKRLGIPSNDRTSTRGLGTHIEEIQRIRAALAG